MTRVNADEIQQVVRQGRSAQVDWLADNAPLNDIAALLVAMANSSGGTLILGVSGHNIGGVRDTESTIDRVLQAALAIEPPLIIPLPRVARIPALMSERHVVLVHIPPGMPHVYALDGRYLFRRGTENAPLTPRELRRLMMERGELSFETEVARGAGYDDLDWTKAETYVANLRGWRESSVERALLKRGCLVQESRYIRPTNAGMLLFGKDPQRYVQGAQIIAARFPGDTMGDKFIKQDITGTLPDQIHRAETFLIEHLRRDVLLRHTMERLESYEYPLEAARELVVNAVAHRNYAIAGDSIRLFIFSSRMEVTSPGGLPGPVTVANIKDERFSRNPTVVQVLSDMGFIEQLGYGVDRVIELMQQQNLHAPEFEERAGGFRVALYNTLMIDEDEDEPEPPPQFNGIYRGTPVNPRQEAALISLHTNARITNGDLQTLCPDVHPETIRRDLADLVIKGILRKMGQKRGSYYVLNRNDNE